MPGPSLRHVDCLLIRLPRRTQRRMMMIWRRFLFLLVFLGLLTQSVMADEQPPFKDSDYSWKHLKTKNGAEISVSETPWSRFRTFKAEKIINQPLEVLVEVMLDVNGFQEWLPGCMLSRHLKTFGNRLDGNFLVHVKWDSIFPIKNRDFVIKVTSDVDWAYQEYLTVELTSVDDSPEPVLEGTKRLKHFYSRYHFTYVDREHTKVSYSMLVDPKLPFFPRWMVEIQTASIPYKTLIGLEERAKKPRFLTQAKLDLM